MVADKISIGEIDTKKIYEKSASLPFSGEVIEEITKKYPTPFYIYDERAILENAARLNSTFTWNKGFREYFAVKALPNPHILKLLLSVNFGLDCSSLAELVMANRVGFVGENIMFTSNDTPANEFFKARELGAIINLDDFEHLGYVERIFGERGLGLPELISFRVNPGAARRGNSIIGDPEEAKFGCTPEQLFAAYREARDKGISRFGLHSMIASNELDPAYFVCTVESLVDLVLRLEKELDIQFEFINMGGGVGIPYRPGEAAVDLNSVSSGIKEVFEAKFGHAGKITPPRLYMECGRCITGPYGYLITRVIHEKRIYKHYLGVDASMANLMRPGMYGSYHHLTVLGKENDPLAATYDVVGSLCENNDKFAINRFLPKVAVGDLLVVHDAGAHAHSMGFNYNGKLRSAELLLRSDGRVECIRRAETLDDYFATII